MTYRREIDGLRALAVVPVMLCHAGIKEFSGGFVGVDVFFVISGYLITSLIRAELKAGTFSLAKFYLRRARRILPALYLVMAISTAFAYCWMMPDEFKNFGQSVFATTLFANNLLLAVTSGYWSLISGLKPLLHTWSLGVEEQYYLLFPLFLLITRSWRRNTLGLTLAGMMGASAIAAHGWVSRDAMVAFYILPTRAWELLIGAGAAVYRADRDSADEPGPIKAQMLSLVGLAMVLASIITYNEGVASPDYALLVPTFGAVLIILYAGPGTVVHRLLGSRVLVGIGLISYSLYLWHQPLLALARIYSVFPPSRGLILALIALAFVLAYGSWRWVETPFRNRSVIGDRAVVKMAAAASVAFLAIGYTLNRTYGLPGRIFPPSVRIEDLDKRRYNDRAFQFKTAGFTAKGKTHLLFVGSSFARDAINLTLETFETKNVEIVYRDDLGDDILSYQNRPEESFFRDADVIVFANVGYHLESVPGDLAYAKTHGKRIFFLGIKEFGYNLNWLVRLSPKERANQFNPLPPASAELEAELAAHIPPDHYLSLEGPVVRDGKIPITDADGNLISTDRQHLTKYGARYFGRRALLGTRYAEVFAKPSSE